MDNIAKINGKAAMAYLGETPWHRLGTPMKGFPNVVAALEAAQLNWNVDLEPMYIKNANGNFGVKVPGRRAVVRDVDHKVLATVGKDYVPLQNAEAFGVLNAACEQFGVTIETAGALGKGDRVWMLAKLPEVIEPVPGDKIEGYFLLTSGHNGWTPYTGRPTPVRVVCQNTLNIAVTGSSAIIKLRHVKTEMEQMELVAGLVTQLIQTLKKTGESFTKLAQRKMTRSELEAYVNEVLKIPANAELSGVAARRRNTIIDLAANGRGVELAPGTAWAAFNAVTEYVDHVRTAKSTKTLKQADVSALFGPTAKLKYRALALALNVAA